MHAAASVAATPSPIPPVPILDFGIAKIQPLSDAVDDAATTESRAALTESGTTVGTVAYMSPEQLGGERLDPRTDLFSFGLGLYEMATGRRAFPGGTAPVVLGAILHENPSPPRD